MRHLFVVGEFVVVSHLKIFPLQLLGLADKPMAGPSSSKGKILRWDTTTNSPTTNKCLILDVLLLYLLLVVVPLIFNLKKIWVISEEEKFTTCWYDTTTTNINDNAERFPNLSFKLLIKERCSWSMWLKGTNLMLLFCFYIFLNSNTNADYPLADFKEKKLRPFCYSIF